MSLDRVVLAVSGVFVLLVGVACAVAPVSFADQTGLSAAPSAVIELKKALKSGVE